RRIEVIAIGTATLLAATAPLRRADDAARGFTVGALADRVPSAQVLLVAATPEDLNDGVCRRSLRPLLQRGGARGAVRPPPADAFCGELDKGLNQKQPNQPAMRPTSPAPRTSPAPPVVPLPLELLRHSSGEVIGFLSPEGSDHAEELRRLDIAAAP